MPSDLTVAKGAQQSSKASANHRHGPFHGRLGSAGRWAVANRPRCKQSMFGLCANLSRCPPIAREFKIMARLARPQKAGSSCVLKTSIRLKNDVAVPAASASAKISFPARPRLGLIQRLHPLLCRRPAARHALLCIPTSGGRERCSGRGQVSLVYRACEAALRWGYLWTGWVGHGQGVSQRQVSIAYAMQVLQPGYAAYIMTAD